MAESFGMEAVTENVADFGKELVHSAVANPWNAVVQIADHIPGVSLSQIHTHGADHKDSIGAQAGDLCGFVLDFAALSLATKGL